jgi:hypothetical protein
MSKETAKLEVRNHLTEMKLAGLDEETMRDTFIDSMKATVMVGTIEDFEQLAEIENGLAHVLSLDDACQVVNEVLHLEFGLEPTNIKEWESPVVESLEQTLGQDIYEIIAKVREFAIEKGNGEVQ